MIKCVRCGTENSDAAQYCDECGERLETGRASKTGIFDSARLTMIDNEPKSDFTESANALPAWAQDSEPQQKPAAESNEKPNAKPAEISNEKPNAQNSESTESAGAAANDLQNPNVTQINNAVTSIGEVSGFSHARLLIERGKNAGKEFVLSETEVNIGRWDADNGIFPDVDLDADDPEAKVSRRHARIVRYGQQYLVEDLGSTNGTFVNRGRRLLPGNRQVIQDGDEIIVGKTFLRFQIIR